MMVVGPVREDPDKLAMKALEILGGPRKLIEYRRLTWLPSLMTACYAVVLKELYHKTTDDIAREFGISEGTVRNIMASDEEAVMKKNQGRTHGGGVQDSRGRRAGKARLEGGQEESGRAHRIHRELKRSSRSRGRTDVGRPDADGHKGD